MINQLRTALLNMRKPDGYPDEPWRRYMDPGFTPVTLTPALTTVRGALVGTEDEWWTLTYVVEALLALLQSSRYDRALARFDDRTTALETQPFSWDYVPSVTGVNGEAQAANYALLRPVRNPTKAVPVRRVWTATLEDADTLNVQVAGQDFLTSYPVVDKRVVWAEDVGLYIQSADVGAVWRVTSYVQPDNVVGNALTRVQSLPRGTFDQLFVPYDNSMTDALAEYKRWYAESPFQDDKLAAVAFAYVAQHGVRIESTLL